MPTASGEPRLTVVVKPVYSILEFCRDFGCGRSSAYEEIKAGRLPVFKIGGRTRIAGEDALSWREMYRCREAA